MKGDADVYGAARLGMVVVMFGALMPLARGADAEDARKDYQEILLWADGALDAAGTEESDVPRLVACPAPEELRVGSAVVVCPGGGYAGLAMDHEGYQIAEWLNNLGVSAFILIYRHGPKYHHPVPSLDAMRAIRTVRARAPEWGIDPSRIGIWGFSAGGHLAATVGVHTTAGDPESGDPIEHVSARPSFMILCYPVISMMDPDTHGGSRRNLLGEDPVPGLVEELSLQLQVTKDTPPTFLLSTTEDQAVSARNSLMFYDALLKAGVPAELHIFQQGRHGLGLGRKEPILPMSAWPDLLAAWLKVQGALPE